VQNDNLYHSAADPGKVRGVFVRLISPELVEKGTWTGGLVENFDPGGLCCRASRPCFVLADCPMFGSIFSQQFVQALELVFVGKIDFDPPAGALPLDADSGPEGEA
jgi:hypothetical protein